jgi:hypothetical protein
MPDQVAAGSNKSEDDGNRPPFDGPAVTNVSHSFPQKYPSNTGGDDSKYDKNNSNIVKATWFQAIFTLGILLINVGYVWVATQQWSAMRAQVEIMHDQASALQVQNGIISNEFSEMKTQSSFMKGQLTALENDQRPFITAAIAAPPNLNIHEPLATGQVIWNVNFSNAGKNLALEFSHTSYLKVGDGTFRASYGAPDREAKTTLPPGVGNFISAISAPDVSPSEFNRFMSQDGMIGVLVIFKYVDAFGNKYIDPVCFQRLASGATLNVDPKDCEPQK